MIFPDTGKRLQCQHALLLLPVLLFAGNTPRECDPINEFKCDNHKCIPITWACDSADDCGDRSDEIACRSKLQILGLL